MSNPLTKSQFDSIIRDNVLKHSGLKSSPFFEAKDGEKAYTNYYNDNAFDEFCDSMQNNYPKAFDPINTVPVKKWINVRRHQLKWQV